MNAALVPLLGDLAVRRCAADKETDELLATWRASLCVGDVVRIGFANHKYYPDQHPWKVVSVIDVNASKTLVEVQPLHIADGTAIAVPDRTEVFPWFPFHQRVYEVHRQRLELQAIVSNATSEQLTAAIASMNNMNMLA